MPELPEVEACVRAPVLLPCNESHRTPPTPPPQPTHSARRLIEREARGAAIKAVVAVERGGGARDGEFDDVICDGIGSPRELEAALVGRTLVACRRRGKQQWWELSGSGLQPTWHFGMSGAFSIKRRDGSTETAKYERVKVDTGVWPPKFTKVQVVFDNGVQLAFTDPRRLGRVRLQRDPASEEPVRSLGPDALTDLPAAAALAALLGASAAPIKAQLLDQSRIAGVGNWVADEVLYQAAIHPETAANALTAADYGRLHDALADVLTTAVAANGDADAFPRNWLFHARWGKGKPAATTADGRAIVYLTVGGRTSAVVPAVQGKPHSTPSGGGGGASGGGASGGGGGSGGGGAAAAPVSGTKRGRPAAAAAAAAAASEAPAAGAPAAAARGGRARRGK